MRKMLLLPFLLLLSSSCNAEDIKDEMFYIKAGIGINIVDDIKDRLPKINQVNLDNKVLKSKSTNSFNSLSPNYHVAFGCYLSEVIRGELAIDYHNINFKKSIILNKQEEITSHFSRNAKIPSVMINTYVNLFDNEDFSIFAGGGVGVAQIKEKLTYMLYKKDTNIEKGAYSAKASSNLAYALTLGTSIKFIESTYIDISYSWKNFGKASLKTPDKKRITHSYKGHNITAGLRFDI